MIEVEIVKEAEAVDSLREHGTILPLYILIPILSCSPSIVFRSRQAGTTNSAARKQDFALHKTEHTNRSSRRMSHSTLYPRAIARGAAIVAQLRCFLPRYAWCLDL